MGSAYYGDPKMGNEPQRTRRGKKSHLEKPKAPQRGLGVAQLEKIRLHTQMASAFFPSHPHYYPYPPNSPHPQEFVQTGMGDFSAPDHINGAEFQATPTPIWNPGNDFLACDMTHHFFGEQADEDFLQNKRMKDRRRAMATSSDQCFEVGDSQELDLELKLSI